ncbi:M20/M25/M40 family metallo-hydrolase [Streptomyces sp. NPDC048436]|uniref:M20/M25/M40 family metallo-hydrolase n=1 Tax=Streptomyces sp. NPDC048436 TaxID=3365550 RepID=UPI0037203C5C
MRHILTRAARQGAAAAPAVAATAVAFWATRGLRPPPPRRGGVGPGEFSVARAARDLRQIAQAPRPSGSAQADAVRSYLVGRLTEFGLEVEEQEAVGVGVSTPTPYGPRYLGAGRVRNVVARLRGTCPGSAVALFSHYDSVAQGPGASDAGVPVAALLEAVRALAQGPAPANDVMVVLTDGEECGLLGARAFFAEHPWAGSVEAVLNFEARGTKGPVLMFETGEGNGPLIEHLADCGVPAFASSLFYEVYRRLPNATDFSVAKEAGVPGMNFANIGDFIHYHGPADDLDHVDDGTFSHHGTLALALAERLGRTPLRTLHGSDATYFTLGHGTLVSYGVRSTRLCAAAAGALWLWSTRRGSDSLREALFGAGGAVPAAAGTAVRLAAGAVASTLLMTAARRISPESRRGGDFYDADLLYGALACGVASTALVGKDAAGQRGSGARTILAAAGTALTATLPGGSYLAAWPLLASAAGTVCGRGSAPVRAAAAATSAVPALLLLPPLSRLLYQALTPRMAAGAVLALQLTGELAAPTLTVLPTRARRGLALALAAAGAVTAAVALGRGRGDGTKPVPESLSWLADADTGEVWWLTTDPAPNPWTRRALGNACRTGRLETYFPGWTRDFHFAPAPALTDDLAAPELTVLDEQDTAEGRRITARVRSPRGARQLSLAIADGDVRRWAVDGRAVTREQAGIGDKGEPWELWLHAGSAEGFLLELELPHKPVSVRLLDRDDGLPQEARERLLAHGPEPAGRIVAAALDVESWGNATFVSTQTQL